MKKIFLLFLAFFLAPLFCPEVQGAVPILKIRHSSGAEYSRIVIDLGGKTRYKDLSPAGSPALRIQIAGAVPPGEKTERAVNDRVVRTVKVESGERGEAEIHILLVRPAPYRIFALSAGRDKPERLVIDVFRPPPETAEKKEPVSPEKPRETPAGAKENPPRVETRQTPEKEPPPLAKFLDIRQWAAPDHTRIVIDLGRAPVYEILPSTDPLTFGILLRRVILPKDREEFFLGDQIIRKMVVEPVGKDNIQVLFSLIKPGRSNVFSLKPYQDKPDRLVIDIYRTDLEEKEKAHRKVSQELKAKRTRIVVIDPGHGGEDPGAIGPNGTKEKDVVLAVARRLQKALDETGEFKAFLTRRGDYFVPLYDRVRIAMEYAADLFISLHVNGNTSRHVRGTSVYCLSPKGATDRAVQMLAQKENASDIVGGASTGGARKDLDSILMDLELTHTINESLQLGGVLLAELRRVNHVQTPHPLQGGFAVLRAPSFPSVLVELAYVTHPVEEKNLRREKFHLEAAQAIVKGLKKFMPVLAVKEEGSAEPAKEKKARTGG